MDQPDLTQPAPLEINLQQNSRLLEVAFTDGFRFQYPCEYLRVFSPSSGGGGLGKPVHGKQQVAVVRFEAQDTCALQLEFDDGHTGAYSWSALHELGVKHEQNWRDYLQRLEALGLQRDPG